MILDSKCRYYVLYCIHIAVILRLTSLKPTKHPSVMTDTNECQVSTYEQICLYVFWCITGHVYSVSFADVSRLTINQLAINSSII